MAHPVYKDVYGKRIPSVTTIIGKFKEAGGLIHWAWDLGIQGIDYRKVRDDAANAGTFAHLMVEADIRNTPQPTREGQDEDQYNKALSAYGAYLEWRTQTQLKPDQTEVSLTCECHRYGGTLDTIMVQGKRSLGDWKTSNSVYPEYLIQLSAYKHLWEINNPSKPIDGGFHLLRFAKSEGDFAHHYWPNLDDAWKAFLHMRELYDLMDKLKQRV
jgi:hypothetical protein